MILTFQQIKKTEIYIDYRLTKNIETSNGTSILGGVTLSIVEVSGDGNDSLGDGLSELGLSDLLHLDEDHGRDLLGGELLLLTLVLNLDEGGGVSVNDGERPVLHVRLDLGVIETATDKTLGIEDGVGGVHGSLVLGGITNETLSLGESNVRRGGTVTLLVGDDLNTLRLPDGNAGVGGTKGQKRQDIINKRIMERDTNRVGVANHCCSRGGKKETMRRGGPWCCRY